MNKILRCWLDEAEMGNINNNVDLRYMDHKYSWIFGWKTKLNVNFNYWSDTLMLWPQTKKGKTIRLWMFVGHVFVQLLWFYPLERVFSPWNPNYLSIILLANWQNIIIEISDISSWEQNLSVQSYQKQRMNRIEGKTKFKRELINC